MHGRSAYVESQAHTAVEEASTLSSMPSPQVPTFQWNPSHATEAVDPFLSASQTAFALEVHVRPMASAVPNSVMARGGGGGLGGGGRRWRRRPALCAPLQTRRQQDEHMARRWHPQRVPLRHQLSPESSLARTARRGTPVRARMRVLHRASALALLPKRKTLAADCFVVRALRLARAATAAHTPGGAACSTGARPKNSARQARGPRRRAAPKSVALRVPFRARLPCAPPRESPRPPRAQHVRLQRLRSFEERDVRELEPGQHVRDAAPGAGAAATHLQKALALRVLFLGRAARIRCAACLCAAAAQRGAFRRQPGRLAPRTLCPRVSVLASGARPHGCALVARACQAVEPRADTNRESTCAVAWRVGWRPGCRAGAGLSCCCKL